MSGAQKVFAIPELLEPILLGLDHFTLFRVKSVCRFWKDCIEHTPSLQRATWKRPLDLGNDDDLFEERPHPAERPVLKNGADAIQAYEHHMESLLSSDDPESPFWRFVYESKQLRGNLSFVEHGMEPHPGYTTTWIEPHEIPESMRGSYCVICHNFHAKSLKDERLHPILQNLAQEGYICINGSRSGLLVTLPRTEIFEEVTGAEHSTVLTQNLEVAWDFGRALRLAYDRAQQLGALQETLTQPPCRVIIVSDQRYSESPTMSLETALFDIAAVMHHPIETEAGEQYHLAWETTSELPISDAMQEYLDWRYGGGRYLERTNQVHKELHAIMGELWYCGECREHCLPYDALGPLANDGLLHRQPWYLL